jgi:hypothetical protein
MFDLLRFWATCKKMALPFAGAVGFAGSIVTIAPSGLTVTAAILVVCATSVGLFLWWNQSAPHLPVEDMCPFTQAAGKKLVLCCPCNAVLSRKANELAARFYGQESIPWEHYELWREKNPSILVCLQDPAGELLGYFDVLPLRKKTAQCLINGQITESHLVADDILSPRRAKSSGYLYVAGITVREPHTHVGRRSASVLTWALLKYLQYFYTPADGALLFAVAATKPGEALLRKFGLDLRVTASLRSDQHNLYARTFSLQFLDEALSRMPDWSSLCQLGWVNAQGRRRRGIIFR